MKRDYSSTKWDRTFVNEPLIALIKEVWLNAITKPQVKIAKHVKKTVYPDGTEFCYNEEHQAF